MEVGPTGGFPYALCPVGAVLEVAVGIAVGTHVHRDYNLNTPTSVVQKIPAPVSTLQVISKTQIVQSW